MTSKLGTISKTETVGTAFRIGQVVYGFDGDARF
jgi:hypothetical protein